MRIAATIPLPDPQASERRPFFATLPLAPYSFRGTLLSLEWTLELVALPGEEKTSVGLILAPGRRAIDLVHRELRKWRDPGEKLTSSWLAGNLATPRMAL
jgi:hypothetical protein